ncbi:hypothetical protein C8A00DRAFT_33873 [Chaetomidium leptoderma]|uniref:Granulins domain-containing protein n=1 Tax=Chaetomidium leptoderma TaxID=669021 RepID=A0AAN6VLB2_9PEZI|nr:hypothetical protein C8A00DRAFT_33873 [Chaetomidium leptoderma]
MYQGIVALFLAAAGALAAAVPGGAGQQKPLGRLTQTSDVTRQYLSCEETYGSEWETCGDRNSRSCYSPALKHSCCGVDNSYCDEGAWCAPVAGYCCSDSEDLEACARNAGFELPDNETLGNLATIVVQASTSTGPPRISAATASSLRRRNADSASAADFELVDFELDRDGIRCCHVVDDVSLKRDDAGGAARSDTPYFQPDVETGAGAPPEEGEWPCHPMAAGAALRQCEGL